MTPEEAAWRLLVERVRTWKLDLAWAWDRYDRARGRKEVAQVQEVLFRTVSRVVNEMEGELKRL